MKKPKLVPSTQSPSDGTPIPEGQFVNNDNDGETTAVKDDAHPLGVELQAPVSIMAPATDIKPLLHADNNPVEEELPEEAFLPDEDSESHVN